MRPFSDAPASHRNILNSARVRTIGGVRTDVRVGLPIRTSAKSYVGVAPVGDGEDARGEVTLVSPAGLNVRSRLSP